ncbi:MAG: PKD domain-containing protein [Bacteroidota bacterium]
MATNEQGICFVENKNQWKSTVLFKADLDGGNLHLEKDRLLFHFYEKEKYRKFHGISKEEYAKIKDLKIGVSAFEIKFLNSSFQLAEGKKAHQDYNNYFIGNNKKTWAGNVKKYNEVYYNNLYQGIDFEIIGLKNAVKYNFYVQPNTNPNQIQLKYNGTDSIFLDKGQLNIITSVGTILEQAPFAYQYIDGKRIKINCEFVLKNNTVSFQLGKYNKNYELIIDPELIFSSYSGSIADNFGMTATPDNYGNLISGGIAFDIGYPTTLGAYDTTYDGLVQSGSCDVVLSKYNNNGTVLMYSTYLGGTETEVVNSIIVNKQNELFIYGITGSSNFPVTKTAFDTVFNGGVFADYSSGQGTRFNHGTDIYVSKLSANGMSLLASTFIGGTQNDGLNISSELKFNYGDIFRGEIMVDEYSEVYVASTTLSSDFPVTVGVVQPVNKGFSEACVFKFNSNLSELIWSTFLGGTKQDAGYSLAVNDSLHVYVTGGTNSSDFFSSTNAYQSILQGTSADGFLTILNKDATAVIASTLTGTSLYDQSYFIQLDLKGYPYILGQTQAYSTFPISNGVYSNPNSSLFIQKFKKDLTGFLFSTLLGSGSSKIDLSPTAFLVDYCETIYLAGWCGEFGPTTTMTLTSDAKQDTTDGFDFYLMRLDKDSADLSYASYFGGHLSREHVDGGTNRFDKQGVVYQSVCAGCTNNDDFPTTPNVVSATNNSTNCNNAVFKLDFEQKIVSANITAQSFKICAPYTMQFFNSSGGFTSYTWDFGNGDVTSTDLNPSRTYNVPGIYPVKLIVENPLTCNLRDTNFIYVEVLPALNVDFDFLVTDCGTNVDFIDKTTGSELNSLSYFWDFGSGNTSEEKSPKFDFTNEGTYNVELLVSSSLGCKDSVEVQLELGKTKITPDTIICNPGNLQLLASGGLEYDWQPTSKLNNSKIANPLATIDETTTFTCRIKTADSVGNPCVVDLSTVVQVSNLYKINIQATDTIFKGDTIQLNALPAGNYLYSWSPINSLSNYKIYNPLAFPSESTIYKLRMADELGCTKDAEVKINVEEVFCEEPNIFVPNTFTPNQDNVNELFRVRGKHIDVESFYFAVYNRWGELIFETTDFTNGWDGVYKGKALDPDVFAYYVKLKCIDGEEFFKKGNITLIR